VSDPTGDALDGVAEAVDDPADQPALLRRVGLQCLLGGRGGRRGRTSAEHQREQHEGSGDADAEHDVPDHRAPGCAQRLVHALTS
jgi:hypothetical protein